MAFSCQQRIDWGDCDEAGVVFYPNYFAWMDAAFHRLCLAAGHSQRSLREDFGVFGTPLVSADCNFRGPATYNETLDVLVSVSHWGASSLGLGYRFERDGRLICEGSEGRVFVKKDAEGRMSKTAIPDAVRTTLETVLAASPA
ncbi:MAG: thioesterase [Salinisphaeraceae bacterium]|nr:thioesterase [Salinisphaeraceae bacterium]